MVLLTKVVCSCNALPPAAALYHLIAVPVAVKSATVLPAQKVWLAKPVGAGVVPELIVTTNEALSDSQPPSIP